MSGKFQRTYNTVAWRMSGKFQRTCNSVAWRMSGKFQRTCSNVAWRMSGKFQRTYIAWHDAWVESSGELTVATEKQFLPPQVDMNVITCPTSPVHTCTYPQAHMNVNTCPTPPHPTPPHPPDVHETARPSKGRAPTKWPFSIAMFVYQRVLFASPEPVPKPRKNWSIRSVTFQANSLLMIPESSPRGWYHGACWKGSCRCRSKWCWKWDLPSKVGPEASCLLDLTYEPWSIMELLFSNRVPLHYKLSLSVIMFPPEWTWMGYAVYSIFRHFHMPFSWCKWQ